MLTICALTLSRMVVYSLQVPVAIWGLATDRVDARGSGGLQVSHPTAQPKGEERLCSGGRSKSQKGQNALLEPDVQHRDFGAGLLEHYDNLL